MTRKMTMIKKTLMMVMMVLGVGTTWGQTDYSGTYYIKSESVNKYPSGDYYLCPTENWAFFHATNIVNNTNNGQPFLTTHIMDNGEEGKYKWIIEKHTVDDHDYYAFKYSIDYVDGESSSSRYLSYNGKITISGTGTDRMRIHLKKIENPTDDELFDITPYSTYWVISPKKVDVDDSNKQKYLVVNGGNTNDFKDVEIYSEYLKMKSLGHKVSYIVMALSDKFNICERKVYKIVSKMEKDCQICAVE